MIIVNKKMPPCPLVLASSQNTPNGTINVTPIVLKPGVNEVSEAMREFIASSATAKQWVAKQWIAITDGKDPKRKDATGLGAFEEDQALDLVADCFDVALLNRFKEGEKRERVRIAMMERATVLKQALTTQDY